MIAYTVLSNLLLLIGVGSVVGILVVLIMINGKLNKLNQNVSEMNKNQSNVESVASYISKADKQVSSLREEELIQAKVKSLQEAEMKNKLEINNAKEQKPKSVVGIVFCRNCASQYTSDKDSCPICGAKRQ
jgi:rubrerythrin